MRAVIITADDFGFSSAVNEAVEEAFLRGILRTTSLIIGAEAATDALERTSRLPGLKVGLHIMLTGGRPVSRPSEVCGLLNADGEFSSRLFMAGVSIFFRPRIRRQLEQEIRAQFELFRSTGLELDHVNCHKHLHLHPTIGELVLKIGAEYGLKAVRLPYEPVLRSCLVSEFRKTAFPLFLAPWTKLLESKIRSAGMNSNDFVLGLGDTGRMELNRVLHNLRYLPPGVTEIYFHPAARFCPRLYEESGHCRHVSEFSTLIAPEFKHALNALKIQQVSFSDLPLKGEKY